jgi:acetyl-CoA C-acetyltransferase
MSVSIVGWSHHPFGKIADDAETMVRTVVDGALEDAGIEAKDIDIVVVGHFNGGFQNQDFPSSLPFQSQPDLRFKPSTRVENACATGSAAIHQAMNAINAGRARRALVVGYEKMTETPGKEIGDILLKCSYFKEESDTPAGFAGVFGQLTQNYFQRYGDQSDALAMIAAKNHLNGVSNPWAQMRKDFGFDFCNTVSDKNPLVAGPLRRTDCSLVSDGAAAIVLSATDDAMSMEKAVTFRAAEHVNDFLPMSSRDMLDMEGPARAWANALDTAGLKLSDLAAVETHDCFTTAELLEYEAMGLTPKGKGRIAVDEGWTRKDGKLPVNPSGGLKAKGHPIGATGVSMHILAAMQALGEAGDMQVNHSGPTAVFNMGGTAVANYVSILEAAK